MSTCCPGETIAVSKGLHLYDMYFEIRSGARYISRLADYEYEGKKSKPEWGLQFSKKHMSHLEAFRFETIVKKL